MVAAKGAWTRPCHVAGFPRRSQAACSRRSDPYRREDRRGPTSRPLLVAPMSVVVGACPVSMAASALTYIGGVVLVFGPSATMAWSAPCSWAETTAASLCPMTSATSLPPCLLTRSRPIQQLRGQSHRQKVSMNTHRSFDLGSILLYSPHVYKQPLAYDGECEDTLCAPQLPENVIRVKMLSELLGRLAGSAA